MTFDEILDKIKADERFTVECESPDIVVRGPGGLFHLYELKPQWNTVIVDYHWESYEAMLMGKRPPTVMKHMTRIVGYYSFVRDWNRSKKAELADRRKGNYALPA